MFVFGFLLPVAFWPTAHGPVVFRWVLLCAALVVLLVLSRPRWSTAHTVYAAFLSWCALTLAWTPFPYDWVAGFAVLLALGAAFMIGAETEDSEPLFIGLALGIGVNLVFAYLQVRGVSFWTSHHPPDALFGNRNILASAATISLVGLLACCRARFWPLALLPLGVLWLVPSRAMVLSLSAMVCVWLWTQSRLLAAAYGALGLLALPVLIQFKGISSWERVVFWKDTLMNVDWHGAGLGSFHQLFPTFASVQTYLARPVHVHNDYIELLFETGLPGLLLFLLFVGAIFTTKARESLVLVAILMEAAVAFPLHLPFTVAVFGIVAGRCLAVRRDVRLAVADGRTVTAHGQDDGRRPKGPLGKRLDAVAASLSEGRGPDGVGYDRWYDAGRSQQHIEDRVWPPHTGAAGKDAEAGPEQRRSAIGAGAGTESERRRHY